MLDEELIEAICCPETRLPLRKAEEELVASLNERIRSGKLLNRGGQTVSEPMEGGLIREDGRSLYPVRHGIPVLLAGEAIELDGAGD